MDKRTNKYPSNKGRISQIMMMIAEENLELIVAIETVFADFRRIKVVDHAG